MPSQLIIPNSLIILELSRVSAVLFIKGEGTMSTKDTILELFEKNRGFYISGEKIAGELNISRTAVWKAVKRLQSEGYRIDAVTNRGYCLSRDSDILSAQGIMQYLDGHCSSLRPEVFVTVGSTNTVCRDKANAGEEEGYVAIAGAQTNGRGRRGRGFFSPADTGIYMSILLKPVSYPGKDVLKLTTMAAVAVCEAIEEVSGEEALIKWVNDIYVRGKKVCGILSEASYGLEDGRLDAVVVGIGINAYKPKGGFPPEIRDRAGCVFSESKIGKRNHLTAEVLNRFMAYYNGDSAGRHLDEYRRRSLVLGKEVSYFEGDSEFSGTAVDLDEDCGLVVRFDDGSQKVIKSGEVSISGIK